MKLLQLFISICVVGISLLACQDKHAQEEDIQINKTKEEELDKSLIPLFDASVNMRESTRFLNISLDELNNPVPGDKSKLRSPRIRFSESRKDEFIVTDVLFRKQKGSEAPIFFRLRTVAKFVDVSQDSRKARIRVFYVKDNPQKKHSLLTLEKGETLHAMMILGGEADPSDQSGISEEVKAQYKDAALFGELPEDAHILERGGQEAVVEFVGRNQGAGTGDETDFRLMLTEGLPLSNTSGRHAIPLVSNWKQFEITTGQYKEKEGSPRVLLRLAQNSEFTIRPQGVLLNYQIAGNLFEGTNIRRAGVISNAFDFQGKYKLDPKSIEDAFKLQEKDPQGFGIPEWEARKSKVKEAQQLRMYYPLQSDNALGFPWDMPTVSDILAQTQNRGNRQEMMQTVAEADVAMSLLEPNNPEPHVGFMGNVLGLAIPSKKLATQHSEFTGYYSDLANYIQWAMPKKNAPDQPFTYFWVAAHSGHNLEEYYQSNLSRLLPDDNTKEYTEFLTQQSVRSQPMLVVHQTNANFQDQRGKTPRLYATISSDLMISELVYKKVGDKNYSVLELQNPTNIEIDLNHYAIARLVSDGSQMKYKKSDGTLTNNLSEAELFRLSSINPQSMVKGYEPNEDVYDVPTDGEHAKSRKGDTRDYKIHTHKLETDGKKRLEPGQIVLLGANGYTVGDVTQEPWWNSFFPSDRHTQWFDEEFRIRYFAACNTSVLGINEGNTSGIGDGIALIKIINNTFKVIDTSAPIGASNLGFAGTYQSYSDEYLNKPKNSSSQTPIQSGYYTQKRMDGVIFPFIPPYRTTRVRPDLWSDDWEVLVNPPSYVDPKGAVTTGKQTLGHRWIALIDGNRSDRTVYNRFIVTSRGRYFSVGRTALGNPQKYNSSRPVHR